MKKFMFSIVAVMVFTISSVAGNHDDNEAPKNNSKVIDECLKIETILNLTLLALPSNHAVCYNRRVAAYNVANSEGATHEVAERRGFGAYFRCMREMPISD
jgi:hypothetical protein